MCHHGPQSPSLRRVQIYYSFVAGPAEIGAQLFLSNGGNNGLNVLGQHLSLILVMALQQTGPLTSNFPLERGPWISTMHPSMLLSDGQRFTMSCSNCPVDSPEKGNSIFSESLLTVIWSAPISEGADAAPPTLEPVKQTFFYRWLKSWVKWEQFRPATLSDQINGFATSWSK